jgi:deoxyribodipyrimidine photo-lyase
MLGRRPTLRARSQHTIVVACTRAARAAGDALWDAAQRQLAAHGELHNNVRMTWGKAFLHWTASPLEALDMALRLNHRFALDGCDPASYGGVLWCFGLFDGPKEARSTPVSGALRRRPTSGHARRLSPAALLALPP